MAPRLIIDRSQRLVAKKDSFSYQAEAVSAIKDLDYAAIFHEQGLGKSKIAIDLLLYWLDADLVDTVILLVKKSLVANWIEELDSHSYLKPKILTINSKENYHIFNSACRLIITHYEVITKESNRIKLFLKTRRVGIILDESAKIKNPEAEVAKELFQLAPLFTKKIIMTGTPIANRPYDIWSQIYFLDQGQHLGTDFNKFKHELDLTNQLHADKEQQDRLTAALSTIFPMISSFSVRETKNSGIINLPDKNFENIYTDWEPIQYEKYKQIQNELRAIIIKDGAAIEDKSENILKRLLRLVQIASNPNLVDHSYNLKPGKLCFLEDLLLEITGRGEKCIVWSSFTENVDYLKKEFDYLGSVKVHGKQNIVERNRAINQFKNNNEVKILFASPGAAKEGLTLTVANNVIFYDRSFSLDDYLQAQDRIHRISQEKACNIINLIMKDSVDEWVDLLLEAKRLSAQLGQGDITPEQFATRVDFSFGKTIREILNIHEREEHGDQKVH